MSSGQHNDFCMVLYPKMSKLLIFVRERIRNELFKVAKTFLRIVHFKTVLRKYSVKNAKILLLLHKSFSSVLGNFFQFGWF